MRKKGENNIKPPAPGKAAICSTPIMISPSVSEVNLRRQRDPLTGLCNRKKLFKDLNSLRRSNRVAVIVADVDHFKNVNDAHGHHYGDMPAAFSRSVLLPQALALRNTIPGFAVIAARDTAQRTSGGNRPDWICLDDGLSRRFNTSRATELVCPSLRFLRRQSEGGEPIDRPAT